MAEVVIPERWNSLEKVWRESWRLLAEAVSSSGNPLRTPVLGTVGAEGCNLRTVVLRRAVEGERLLGFNTDRRSAKVGEIEAHSRISWLFYHPEEKVQFRLAGQATLHADGPQADEEWAKLSEQNRRDYCVADRPGSPLTGPGTGLPEAMAGQTPTPAESEAGRKNFVIVHCRVDWLDWLLLQDRGHLRAQFSWQDNVLSATWVVP